MLVQCPNCKTAYNVSTDVPEGATFRCSRCKQTFEINPLEKKLATGTEEPQARPEARDTESKQWLRAQLLEDTIVYDLCDLNSPKLLELAVGEFIEFSVVSEDWVRLKPGKYHGFIRGNVRVNFGQPRQMLDNNVPFLPVPDSEASPVRLLTSGEPVRVFGTDPQNGKSFMQVTTTDGALGFIDGGTRVGEINTANSSGDGYLSPQQSLSPGETKSFAMWLLSIVDIGQKPFPWALAIGWVAVIWAIRFITELPTAKNKAGAVLFILLFGAAAAFSWIFGYSSHANSKSRGPR